MSTWDRPPPPRSLQVLVAEDDPDAAAGLQGFLESLGHRVRTVQDGDDAVIAAEAARPDLIFMDIGLPRMNGLAAAEKIRRLPWGQDVIIVAVTGWSEDSDRRRSKESGFDQHLLKPLRPGTILAFLASIENGVRSEFFGVSKSRRFQT